YTKHRELRKASQLLGMGLGVLVAEGDAWRKSRRVLNPSFRSEMVREYAATVVAQTEAFATGLAAGPFEVHRAMTRLTLDITVDAFFGAGERAYAEEINRGFSVVNEWVANMVSSLS